MANTRLKLTIFFGICAMLAGAAIAVTVGALVMPKNDSAEVALQNKMQMLPFPRNEDMLRALSETLAADGPETLDAIAPAAGSGNDK